jgi:hypothetical protein
MRRSGGAGLGGYGERAGGQSICVHVKGSFGFLTTEASRDAKSVRVQYRFSALSVKLGENLSTAHGRN